MNADFKDKVAIVTGGSSGIGAETVRLLIERGAHVIAADIDDDGLARFADSLGTASSLSCVKVDVTSRQSTESLAAQAMQQHGRLDVLVNSAGITRRNVADDADFEDAWDQVIAVNLKGSMLMSHACVEQMRLAGNGGAIVNMASIMSTVVYHHELGLSDGFNPYPHSKGGVLQLTRDLAVQLAPEGIRANSVCPGFIKTPLTAGITSNPEFEDKVARRHPLGRLGTPTEVANAIVFLASDAASFVTGASLAVDGGYLAT